MNSRTLFALFGTAIILAAIAGGCSSSDPAPETPQDSDTTTTATTPTPATAPETSGNDVNRVDMEGKGSFELEFEGFEPVAGDVEGRKAWFKIYSAEKGQAPKLVIELTRQGDQEFEKLMLTLPGVTIPNAAGTHRIASLMEADPTKPQAEYTAVRKASGGVNVLWKSGTVEIDDAEETSVEGTIDLQGVVAQPDGSEKKVRLTGSFEAVPKENS